jgi:hypothetical protein
MARKRKPSKKRSAASSTAKLLEQTVFYLDESIYSRVLAGAIADLGAQVRTPADAAGFGAADAEWLTTVAESGWLVLMRDQRIRYRRLERDALTEAGIGSFVFTGGQASAAETAAVVTRMLQKLSNIGRSEPKPFLYSFGATGSLTRIKLQPVREHTVLRRPQV